MAVDFIYAAFQWIFLCYFLGLTAGYLTLNLVSLFSLRRYFEERALESLPQSYTGFEPQISIIVPAHNEAATIASSIRSLLQLNYSEYEIIVVNDGSKDGTIDVLRDQFELRPFPEAYHHQLPTKPIRAIYHSATHANVRVIDKDNGGKADSLNAGINLSIYPLFCCIDADSILQRDSLRRVVQPFLNDHHTVACGGTVRIANGCRVDNGLLTHVRLPSNVLALFQIVEYLRAFLFGRLGWSPLNAMLIISGAFGLFHKDSVVTVGGYRSDTIGEDMELVVRLHRHFRLSGQPYRITYVPDPVCWTEAPEDLRTLQNQRIRWQRGLCDSLKENLDLCCHPKGGTVGWLAFPFMALFEWLGPAIEVFGYGSLLAGFLLGYVSFETWLILVTAAIGLGVLLSLSALLLEEMSFHIYPKQMDLLKLVCAAIAENFGYRQLNSCWKLIGLYRWMRGSEASWGTMIRNATWDVR